MTTPTTTDPYAALPPAPAPLHIAGTEVDLTPIRIGELPAFARAMQPLTTHIASAIKSGTPALQVDWLTLIADHGDSVLAAVAIATRQPLPWVQALQVDDAITLAQAVLHANLDFFTRQVVPKIQTAGSQIGAMLLAAPPPQNKPASGPTPSKPSSAQATATRTS